ncbi:hypothetical protein MPNT_60054 [Candidatus Methylacidithermus pantelleriae]|uniref:Uncharacterized protein n=1 Tax=Candidatus Methylacidithermus pantelleriae TaxID=2744239 RepID=A0A8J2BP77_9BACT|nr:hypothetical protein MPNT_60054 [Candidatus Methylacidithermus pantelleriae]
MPTIGRNVTQLAAGWAGRPKSHPSRRPPRQVTAVQKGSAAQRRKACGTQPAREAGTQPATPHQMR